jgi:hypothetical protein
MGDVIDRQGIFAASASQPAYRRNLAWPALDDIGLDPAQAAARRCGIGGSDANVILSGDRERVLNLWREKRGEQAPTDLRDNLAVVLGSWTEAFNRLWYEKVTGQRIDEINLTLACPTNSWRRCTLDGYQTATDTIWEAKHTNAFAKPDDVLERYMPQLQHNMAVARVDQAVLSVIFGNHKFEFFEIASDWVYQIELLQAEVDFWDCVVTGREPVPAAPPAPPKPVGIREVCLDGNNAWANAAVDWLEHREAAKTHTAACAGLKELVEPDVARAFGHGIEAKRSKAGAISKRELP